MASTNDKNILEGFSRKTKLTPEQEALFQLVFKLRGMKNPDDPTYDSRAAFLNNQLAKPGEHGVSTYKGLGDERLLLPIGDGGKLLDTRTAEDHPDGSFSGPTPDPQLLNLWKIISGVMNKKKDGN